jgi:hypothetical protein
MPKAFLSLLPYYLYRLGGAVLPHVSPHLGYHLAEVMGTLLYALAPGVRRRVSDNVVHVLGNEASRRDVHRTTRQVLGNVLKNYPLPAASPDAER